MVDLFHLENDVVWDAGFSQQHVQLAGHAPSDGVDAEPARKQKSYIPADSNGQMTVDLRTTGIYREVVFDLA